MKSKALKQYLEFLCISGIDEIAHLQGDKGKKSVSKIEERPANHLPIINTASNQRELPLPENNNSFELIDNMQSKTITDNVNLLETNKLQYKDCQKCNLHSNRMNFVYGEGNPNSKMMLIGEGPGADENRQGKPFVGRAGQLLTKMLAAIALDREEVYITNIVKCQPPDNRNPLPDEVNSCLPYLTEQIRLIQPKLIILLGKVAASSLLGATGTLGELRLKKFNYDGIETFVTYHPAALMRNPSLKKLSWADLQKYRDIYNSDKP